LTLLPFIPSAGELKTKPTQHSVKELRSIGIQPDILLCRTEREIPVEERRKLGLFCNVRESAVIEAHDVASIYDVPRAYHAAGLDKEVLAAFEIEPAPKPDMSRWNAVTERVHNPEGEVTIAIVGKYTGLKDAYKSSSIGSNRRFSKPTIRPPILKTCMAFWCRAVSDKEARKAKSSQPASHASAKSRFLAFASACKWP
jgi:CTP synthase (UTP-ammonia lyase)